VRYGDHVLDGSLRRRLVAAQTPAANAAAGAGLTDAARGRGAWIMAGRAGARGLSL
jgi:hypothetical protein